MSQGWQAQALIELVCERFPDWNGLEYPPFVADEIEYKQKTVAKAQELLSETEVQELLKTQQYDLLIERLDKLGKDNNLLWRRVPHKGDLAILYDKRLNKPEFCLVMRDLLYSKRPLAERFQQYLDYVMQHGLPNKWTFPTYFLFICHPDSELFVKPKIAKWFLKFMGAPDSWTTKPSAAAYTAIRFHAHTLKKELAAQDMIDVQSVIWVSGRESAKRTGRLNLKGQVELDVPQTQYEATPQQAMLKEESPQDQLSRIKELHRKQQARVEVTPIIPEPPKPKKKPIFTLEDCAKTTGFAIEELQRWERAIERKGQVILYGPPGTGKTYLAEHFGRYLAGADGYVQLVQFHPSYTYEDFIEGIRPQENEDGKMELKMSPGRFRSFCEYSRRRSGRSVLIVDEINRANLSRVFGELMYLLEYRANQIHLAGAGLFSIPENVRIIGTMNTADRSIALVDHALRRRFAFIELFPRYDLLLNYHAQHNPDLSIAGLLKVIQRLNSHIDRHYQVGITFFFRPNLTAEIADIWEMEIVPYLDEYFFDQPDKVDLFRWEKVKDEIGL